LIFLRDTNAWIALMNPGESPVQQRFHEQPVSAIGFCSIVKAELIYGAQRSSRRASNLALLDQLFEAFESLPFDDSAAKHYGPIRADLAAQGVMIGPYDLCIAAFALANDLVVVTHNMREFSRVANLRLEDWAA
jgi:tRNA(fMet)-specific endonuclease VapC